MRIHIMGSGAAEGWPAVFCRCDACKRARAAGGKSVRTRSGALIDGVYKFDWNSDTYLQALRDSIDLSEVRHLIYTHTHGDHYYTGDFPYMRPPFAHGSDRIDVWGDHWAIDGVRQKVSWFPEDALHAMEAFHVYELDDAKLTPLTAAHYPERGCFNYIFERGGKTLFYGQDSGWFPDEHWEAQRAHRFDVVILDCTSGPKSGGAHHGDFDTVLKVKERMLAEGTASENTLFIANHFSHNGGALHDEITEYFQPHGVLVSYDGMVVEV